MATDKRGENALPLVSPFSLIALDVGEITGIAVLTFETGYADLRCASTKYSLQILPLLALLRPDVIILERIPVNHSLEYEAEITYKNIARKAFLVSPGDWKPVMKNRKWKSPQASNQHEQDAVDMIRYYLFITQKEDFRL